MRFTVATYNIHKGFTQLKGRMVIHELRERLRDGPNVDDGDGGVGRLREWETQAHGQDGGSKQASHGSVSRVKSV